MINKEIKQLIWQATFGEKEEKKKAYLTIKKIGEENGIFLASINSLYKARAKKEVPLNFTVPAINIRSLTYDMARVIFKVAIIQKVGALIFEIARSEMGYTNQAPEEYTSAIIAAAISEKFKGPLFIQGDHFQIKSQRRSVQPKEDELENVKNLIKDSIEAGFYNIDIDLSTLVDYSQQTIDKQQKINYTLSAELAEYIRSIEPEGIIISLGGEIGHIGGKNSTKEELIAYMEGFNNSLKTELTGLSKIAIQTGTHHGGVPLPDGTLADDKVDFTALKELSQLAREYNMGGAVQHGASTLPDKYFSQFPESEAIEVHLATGFQNIIMNHPKFPKELVKDMHEWLDDTMQNERSRYQTDAQFHYKLRKKAWGQFKKECWSLPDDIKQSIMNDLEKRFVFIFKELNVNNTKEIVEKFIGK